MTNLFNAPNTLAEQIFQRQNETDLVVQEYSQAQKARCLSDIKITLNYLNQALQLNSPGLFADYLVWLKIVLSNRGIHPESTEHHFKVLTEVVQTDFPQVFDGENAGFFTELSSRFDQEKSETQDSHIDPDGFLGIEAQQYLDFVLQTQRKEAISLVNQLSKDGVSLKDLYLHLFQPIQREVGRLWQLNKISVAQEHYVTAVTQLSMSQLYPQLFTTERSGYRLVAASVGNELHEIGIRMVSDFFEMAGWDTYYMGANTPVEGIIDMINLHQADVVALSVTMSSQILRTQSIIAEIRKNVSPDVKILVGGYPFNVEPMAWRYVGADGYAVNADQAIETAYALIEKGA